MPLTSPRRFRQLSAWSLLLAQSALMAQDFRITEAVLNASGRLELGFPAEAASYYRLIEGATPDAVNRAVGLGLTPPLISPPAAGGASFFRVEQIARTASLDSDGDQIPDVYELTHPPLDGLDATDAGADPDGNGKSALQEYQDSIAPAALTTITGTSPFPGESGVSVNREAVVYFSEPLAASAVVTTANFYAGFGGRKFLSRVELSSDRRKASLFFLEPIPGSTRVTVVFDATAVPGGNGRPVDADGDGEPGGVHLLEFDTYSTTSVAGTAISGVVYASDPVPPRPDGSTNLPLPGVIVTVDGAEESLRATTDADGRFTLTNCPAGRFFVHVDGRTSPLSQWPTGAYYPVVGKAWDAAGGRSDNVVPGGVVYLPQVPAGTLQPVSLTEDTTIGLSPEVLAENPALAGVKITVPANSLFNNDGLRGGRVGIAIVDPTRLPEPLPDGLDHVLDITVQSDGAQNFDRPVPACFPNVPNRYGVVLEPGEQAVLMSFNHDTGRWETSGTMTVSADGTLVCTDPGVGIRQPGWHGFQAPLPRTPPGPPAPPVKPFVPDDDDTNRCRTRTDSRCVANCDDAGRAAENDCDREFNEKVDRGLTSAGIAAAAEERDRCKAAARTRRRECADRCVTTVCDGSSGGGAPNESGPARHAVGSVEQASALMDQIGTRLAEIRGQDRLPSEEEMDEINALLDQLRAITGPDVAAFFAGARAEALQQAAQNDLYSWGAPPYPIYRAGLVVATVTQGTPGPDDFRVRTALVRSTTDPYGQYQVFTLSNAFGRGVRPAERVDSWFYDPRTRSVGRASIQTTGEELQAGRLPSFTLVPLEDRPGVIEPLLPATVTDELTRHGGLGAELIGRLNALADIISTAVDQMDGRDVDRDGLPDLAEFIIGTSAQNPDSDGDGILDGAELDQGLDPLDGRPSAIGVIASVPLPGEAVDVAAFNDRVLVALRAGGVGMVEVGSGRLGVLAAQLNVPGEALNVALNQDFGVAGGTFPGALVFDPRAPVQTVRRLDFGDRVTVTAAWVEAGQGWFALSNGELRLVDLATGTELDRTPLTGAIHDLGSEAGVIVAVTTHELLTFRQEAGAIAALGRTALGLAMPDLITGRRRVSVGDGVAFVTDLDGFGRFDFSDPARPLKLSESQRYGPAAFKQILPNGSGSGLAIVGGSPNPPLTPAGQNVQAFDLSDPSVNNAAREIHSTPGVARAGSLYHNFAYVADGRAGLQIINYLASDTGTNPPSLTLRTEQAEGRAESGQPLRLHAAVSDDVQVRRVEFYLDGERLAADGNFPFEVAFTAPARTAERTLIRVRAKATDTAGNETLSDEISLELVPDATPPRVVRSVPGAGALLPSLSSVLVFFSEAILPDSATEAAVQLLAAGADGQVGTADDLVVANVETEVRGDVPSLAVTTAQPLAPGRYRLRLAPPLADLAGNALAEPFTMDLVVYDGAVDTDGDGLPDDVERLLGSDPTRADSNGNGVPDGLEDADRDGLGAALELLLGFDPRLRDSDGNGIADGDEDPDRDGLSNRREQAAGTNPLLADTDGDGWIDEAEVTAGSDPLNPLSRPFLAALAQPAAEVIAPAADFGPNSQFGPTLARPPVEIIAPVAVFGPASSFGPTLARPPAEVIVPAAVFGAESSFGPTLARPPVEVIAPAAVFGPDASFGPTLAQPPAEVIVPGVGAGTGGFGPTLGLPPVTLRIQPQ